MKLISAPVLSYADHVKHFILTCDASDTAVGYVLGQIDNKNREYVIAYGGKSLTQDQKKYNTTEKECLAVLSGIEAYRPYLAHGEFDVITDHRALLWLKTAKHTGRLERWALKLQEYNCNFIHRPGKSNGVADALSRRNYDLESTTNEVSKTVQSVQSVPHQCEEMASNKQGVSVTFCYATEVDTINVQQPENKPELKELQQTCNDFKLIYQYLIDGTLPRDKTQIDRVVAESKYYSLVDGVLYHWYQRRARKLSKEIREVKQLALPRVLRQDALRSYDDGLAGGGHLGVEKVKSALIQKYYWPGMHGDIADYIKSCDPCQSSKRDYHPFNPPMVNMPISQRFERWHIDILGPLNRTQEGFEYILLCIDSCTRWPEAFPLKTQSAKETADVLYKEIYTRNGAPKVLFSDRGRNFMSNLVNALFEIFEVTQHHTSAYHPYTNGMVERQNSTLVNSLRTYCGKEQSKWRELIPSIMMAFRKSPSMHSTEFSPFYMVFGEEMRLPFDTSLEPADHIGKDAKAFTRQCIENLKIAQEIAQENQIVHQQQNKARHDLKSSTPNFKVGDLVMFKVTKIPKGMSSKLYVKAEGPYKIIDCGPNYTYKIKRCSDNKINSSLINASNLRHYHDPNTQRSRFEPQADSDVETIDPEESDNKVADNPQPPLESLDTNPTINTQDNTQDPQTEWNFKNLPRARFKNGRHEIRVEWENGERTWEQDHSFPPGVLEFINKKYTQRGKLRRTYFKRKEFSQSNE